MNEDDLRHAWKDQPMTLPTLTLEALKTDARRLRLRVMLRNSLEWLACAFVIVAFGRYFMLYPTALVRAGSLLCMLGTAVVAWQLYRRASNAPAPTARGEMSWLQHQRAQLVRQREALHSAWWWYVAPFVPGAIVFRLGVELELPPDAPFARGWIANLTIAGVLLAVAVWNRIGARGVQRQIDALDAQTR